MRGGDEDEGRIGRGTLHQAVAAEEQGETGDEFLDRTTVASGRVAGWPPGGAATRGDTVDQDQAADLPATNRQIVLRRRPHGLVDPATDLETVEVRHARARSRVKS